MLEIALLVFSILLFVSILVGRVGGKLGIPVLVMFITVGMIFGSDGVGIKFNNLKVAEAIGTVALCIILFSGGLNTKFSEIKPVISQSLVLATLGVILTAMFTGFFAWWLCGELLPSLGFSLITAFLLSSVMSSTDSAAVFAILGSKDVKLKNNLRPTLECESGCNDPMAYMLTITIIGLIKSGGEPNIPMIIVSIITEILIGALAGYFIAKLAVKFLNKIKLDNDVYYPIIVLTFCIFIFSFTHFIKGNGYLAIYIGGLVIGNSKFLTKRTTFKVFDAISWLSQIVMFLMLGLLVDPHDLIPVAIPALLIGLFVIFVARPLSVFISLAPFRKINLRDKFFLSWVGLRGAVPIIFAIYPLTANVPHAKFIFNVVFFITLLSILLQGTFLVQVAKWLDLIAPSKKKQRLDDFDVDLAEDIGSISTEVVVNEEALKNGNKLMNISLPDDALVVLVKRGEKYFIPKGKTELMVGDKLLVMMNSEQSLSETYQNMGIPQPSASKGK